LALVTLLPVLPTWTVPPPNLIVPTLESGTLRALLVVTTMIVTLGSTCYVTLLLPVVHV